MERTTQRFGPSTLVEAGVEKLIFDVGRGVVVRLDQAGIPYAAITGIFFTHLHSDHVSGLPDLWLTGRFGAGGQGRPAAMDVWGPAVTDSMVEAGTIFTRVRPKLAVYSHIATFGVSDAELIARTRKTYAGPLTVGVDLMSFDVADAVTLSPPK